MSNLPPGHRDPPAALVGYRSNEEWQNLLAQFAALAQTLEDIEHEATREKVMALLQATDAIHREALHRLVRLFKEGVLEQVITDPAIHTLMGMYDLLPEQDPACAKVWDFIADPPAAAGEHDAAAVDMGAEQPRWMPLPDNARPKAGEAVVVTIDGRPVICADVEGQHYAATALCPSHGVEMTGGRLSGYSWICPAGPGCVYDIRDGARLGGGTGLTCHPVRTTRESGGIRIGLGMPFTPRLPAF